MQLLGRADNVRDFVRRGESEGYVQIWLSTGRSEPIVIKRSLKAAENASEWRINGEPPPPNPKSYKPHTAANGLLPLSAPFFLTFEARKAPEFLAFCGVCRGTQQPDQSEGEGQGAQRAAG